MDTSFACTQMKVSVESIRRQLFQKTSSHENQLLQCFTAIAMHVFRYPKHCKT